MKLNFCHDPEVPDCHERPGSMYIAEAVAKFSTSDLGAEPGSQGHPLSALLPASHHRDKNLMF